MRKVYRIVFVVTLVAIIGIGAWRILPGFSSSSRTTHATLLRKGGAITPKHTYAFVFSDTHVVQSSMSDPLAISKYVGPNVDSNAKPVPPGTIVDLAPDDGGD